MLGFQRGHVSPTFFFPSFSPPRTHLALLLFNIAFNMMHALVNTRSATTVVAFYATRILQVEKEKKALKSR